jgi:hypothetical protein
MRNVAARGFHAPAKKSASYRKTVRLLARLLDSVRSLRNGFVDDGRKFLFFEFRKQVFLQNALVVMFRSGLFLRAVLSDKGIVGRFKGDAAGNGRRLHKQFFSLLAGIGERDSRIVTNPCARAWYRASRSRSSGFCRREPRKQEVFGRSRCRALSAESPQCQSDVRLAFLAPIWLSNIVDRGGFPWSVTQRSTEKKFSKSMGYGSDVELWQMRFSF